MKNNYISYYELLTRIKERNIPPKIILHLVPNKSVEYISDYDYVNSEFIGYEILKDEEVDENYSYHLGDCFLENTMFDKVIETKAGCTVSTHCGPNTLGIIYFNDGGAKEE